MTNTTYFKTVSENYIENNCKEIDLNTARTIKVNTAIICDATMGYIFGSFASVQSLEKKYYLSEYDTYFYDDEDKVVICCAID